MPTPITMTVGFLSPLLVRPRHYTLPRNSPKISPTTPRANLQLPAEPVDVLAKKALHSLRLNSKRVPDYLGTQTRHHKGPVEFRQKIEHDVTKPAKGVRTGGRRSMLRDGILLSELVVGAKLRGMVQNMVKHGVYVDVGAVTDGLVHVRDMSVEFIHEPRDLVRTGDVVDVWVKYVDCKKNVLGLSMVKPKMGFTGRVEVGEIKKGQRYRGVVERVTNYGAYVDVGAERLGFLHVSGMWGEQRRENLEKLRFGEAIWVHVEHVDIVRSFIRLIARRIDGKRLGETGEAGWSMDSEERKGKEVGGEFGMMRSLEELEKNLKSVEAYSEVDSEDENVDEDTEGENDEDDDDEDDESEVMDYLYDDDELDDETSLEPETELGRTEGSSFFKENVVATEEFANLDDDDTDFLNNYRL